MKKMLGHSTRKNKPNDLVPQRQIRGAYRTQKLLPLCHTVVKAPKSRSQGGGLSY